MNRTKGILAAGSLTGLVIITLLALGFGNGGVVADGDTAVPPETAPLVAQPKTTDPTANEALQAWQEYSADLEQTVRTLQDRENTYRGQIDSANATIIQLQDQVNSANAVASGTAYEAEEYEEDDESHEEEYEESEEHEEDDD